MVYKGRVTLGVAAGSPRAALIVLKNFDSSCSLNVPCSSLSVARDTQLQELVMILAHFMGKYNDITSGTNEKVTSVFGKSDCSFYLQKSPRSFVPFDFSRQCCRGL